ncbi:MAG: glycosyltransferase family 4 protein, partial [Candidatus Omnitrophica bacterium]|nr:glycosyltransferase family 4 protein [Candidatus Omnitrophota bacterium]
YLFIFLLYDVPRFFYMLFANRHTFKALYEIIKYTPEKRDSAINKKPHILNIVHRYHPAIGGAEMYVKETSERLAADGYRVTVFTTDAWDLEHFWKPSKRRAEDHKESCNGVNIERFRVFRFPFHNIIMRTFYQLPFMFFKALFSLPSPVLPGMWKRLFFDNHDRFDMVHVTALPYNSLIYMAMRYAKKNNIPLIITPFLHLGEHKNDKVRRYYTRDFQMKLLSGSSRIIVQTLIECDYLKGIGIDEKKISIVGQGVNIEDIQGGNKARFRKRFNIEEKDLVFHVAAKSYDKGTFHVVEAMKRVWKNNKDVRLVLAGPPMDEFNKYFSAQDSLVKEKCLVLDSIMNEDKKDLFAAGDVLVLPSRTDSFGAVFLEAWASKKPVIGARAGGIPEVIKHEEDGYLVRFSDIEAISHYIERLLGDRDLAQTMGEKGYSKTQNSSTWDERYKVLRGLFS